MLGKINYNYFIFYQSILVSQNYLQNKFKIRYKVCKKNYKKLIVIYFIYKISKIFIVSTTALLYEEFSLILRILIIIEFIYLIINESAFL